MENKQTVTVIGAGLAGSEAAWQIAQAGYSVRLFEMKPQKFSPAHKSAGFAELICSNSLKAARINSAAGLLKEEMRRMDSLLVACADKTAVPAGGALAVDRDRFSELVTKAITEHPNIEVMHGEVTEIPAEGVTVIASGPLTSDTLAEQITDLCGGALSFFDAAAMDCAKYFMRSSPPMTPNVLIMGIFPPPFKLSSASFYGNGRLLCALKDFFILF